MGSDVKARAGSHKLFLLGDCAISLNRDRKDAIPIKGCPPPVLDAVMAIVLKSFPKKKATSILISRTAKKIGTKLGVYHEVFPVFGVCEPPEFDSRHF